MTTIPMILLSVPDHIMTCGTVVLSEYFPTGSRRTTRGQQRGQSHETLTTSCSEQSGPGIVSICDTQRHVSGLGFPICLQKQCNKLLTHILLHLFSRPSATMILSLSSVFSTTPLLTSGCRATRQGLARPSPHHLA